MTRLQRAERVIRGLLMLLCCFFMIGFPDAGFLFAAIIFSVSVMVYAVRMLIYYFNMARHMVGGKAILYLGIAALDFSVFVFTSVDNPELFIVLYLLAAHGFSGVVAVLRAIEAKRFDSPNWKWILTGGIANFLVAVFAGVAGFYLKSQTDITYLYASSLLYSAITQFAGAFRKTDIIFIQ